MTERRHPEYDPVPIKIGSFDLLATADARITYNDNIFAANSQKVDDAIGTLAASADFRSNWARHALRGYARGDLVRYADNTSQNVELFGVGAAGVVDVARGSTLQGGAEFNRNVLSRYDSRSATARLDQVLYNDLHAFAGGTYGANRLHLSAVFDTHLVRYVDTTSPAGTEVFQDYDRHELRVRADYALGPSIALFAQGVGNKRNYHNAVAGQPLRNSKGVELTAGANFQLPTLMRGEIGIGYIQQRFDSPLYTDFKGFAYHGQLEYFPTRLLTLTATADRSVEDSALVGVGAFIANTYSLKADYELLRNLIITAGGEYGTDRYRGIDLRFRRYGAFAKARYTFSPALVATLQFEHQARTSHGTVLPRDFAANQLSAVVSYRF